MIVKVFFLLRQFRVTFTRVLKVEKFHKTEVLEIGRLILEEGLIEFLVLMRSEREELRDLKYCVAIVILL